MKVRIDVSLPDAGAAERFERACKATGKVKDIEAWPDHAELELADGAKPADVVAALAAAGIEARLPERAVRTVAIDGMTCRACELTVEKKFKALPGVRRVRVNAAQGWARIETDGAGPDRSALAAAVEDDGYAVRDGEPRAAKPKPGALELAALFGTVLLAAKALGSLGVFSAASTAGLGNGATGFVAAMLLGLVAGSSSCLAVSGGLMLSMAGEYRERYGARTGIARMTPVFAFLAGRVVSYGALGGAIGALGRAFTPSPLATGAITLLAAAAMIVMGLDLLGIAPAWLKNLMPRLPKALGRKVLEAKGAEHPAMPFFLGAATFFIPCGFTQALQIYALSAGGFARGAAILGGFAVGTVPALLALGWASSSLKGKAGELFLKFSGAVVVVLGLWNVQNGLTVTGHPLTLPHFAPAAVATTQGTADPNVRLENGKQKIVMRLTDAAPYYAPSDHFDVKAGVPVNLEVDGSGGGCRSVFQIPEAGVELPLTKDVNTVEFTPDKPGTLTFSCAMGMYRGTLNVRS
jgi:sulfite exporter TauE/SafE/copper chaperone CopZ